MDFFERQDKARKQTGLLVLYFIVAIVLIIAAVNLVFYFFFTIIGADQLTETSWFDGSIWLYVSFTTLAVILLGSLFRFFSLASGGQAVAEMAGARKLDFATKKTQEKIFINVVEEMSIASGTAMPVLYVMDHEQGINAFVAGYKPTEAVMVVTQGCLDNLDRDELQGVVGHEFSHILNGDMRLNVRLMAILAGILVIGQIGQFMFRGSARQGYSRSRKSGGQAGLIVLAIALIVVGYIGLFFGRLIKAAISRQREYLADSSSVQFTRNSKGIAAALYKIMNHSKAAYLNNRHAEDVSHMCFGEAVSVSMQSMLASHPPLEDRIKSVNTGFLKIQNAKNIIKKRQDEKASKINASDADKIHASTVNVVNSVGNPTAEHMMYALAMHRSLTPTIVSNIHKASGAKAIVYALILSDVEIDIAINYLVEHHQGQIIDSFKIVYESVKKINQRHKLPLIDLALPVLKQLNQSDRNEFLSTTEALIKLDKKYTFFEFVLFLILKKHLNENSSRVDKVNVYSFKSVCHELQLLLSLMIHASRQSQQKKIQVYKEHMSSFCSVVPDFLPVEQCKLKMIEKMLNKLSGLSPLLKKPVINACVEAILDDGIVMPMEAELLRAVSEMLDCPMPPLLDD